MNIKDIIANMLTIKKELTKKADKDHIHNNIYYTKQEIDKMFLTYDVIPEEDKTKQ